MMRMVMVVVVVVVMMMTGRLLEDRELVAGGDTSQIPAYEKIKDA
jgi:hypothetical protein